MALSLDWTSFYIYIYIYIYYESVGRYKCIHIRNPYRYNQRFKFLAWLNLKTRIHTYNHTHIHTHAYNHT